MRKRQQEVPMRLLRLVLESNKMQEDDVLAATSIKPLPFSETAGWNSWWSFLRPPKIKLQHVSTVGQLIITRVLTMFRDRGADWQEWIPRWQP
jgi:hypothetical protein